MDCKILLNGKMNKPISRWCQLDESFVLFLYKKDGRKADRLKEQIAIPGKTVHYGSEDLKSASVVPSDGRLRVLYVFTYILIIY